MISRNLLIAISSYLPIAITLNFKRHAYSSVSYLCACYLHPKSTANIPKLYKQDGLGENAIVHLILEGLNSRKWYITEYDGLDTFFGFVKGFCDEWGYISKSELNRLILKNHIYIASTELKKLKEYIYERGCILNDF